jgi:hypothetical protein
MITRTELDVGVRLINECADSNKGRHHAARNKVPSPSDTSYDWLPLRRLEGMLARRLEQKPAALSRYGSAEFTHQRLGGEK